jgi:hypothetical protein
LETRCPFVRISREKIGRLLSAIDNKAWLIRSHDTRIAFARISSRKIGRRLNLPLTIYFTAMTYGSQGRRDDEKVRHARPERVVRINQGKELVRERQRVVRKRSQLPLKRSTRRKAFILVW